MPGIQCCIIPVGVLKQLEVHNCIRFIKKDSELRSINCVPSIIKMCHWIY
jgi:hypothetical protein